MDNLNHPPAFGRFLTALLQSKATIGRFLTALLQSKATIGRFLTALLQSNKATTAITPLVPTDFSFRLAVRCRWGQKT